MKSSNILGSVNSQDAGGLDGKRKVQRRLSSESFILMTDINLWI